MRILKPLPALMAIEKSNIVDAVGIEKTTGDVVLTIADYLDWETSEAQHLELLQEKLNAYLRFIESGELLESGALRRGQARRMQYRC